MSVVAAVVIVLVGALLVARWHDHITAAQVREARRLSLLQHDLAVREFRVKRAEREAKRSLAAIAKARARRRLIAGEIGRLVPPGTGPAEPGDDDVGDTDATSDSTTR